MKYLTEYLWEQGNRFENEDSIAILQVTAGNTPALLAVVADGIGGLSHGELASAVVTNRLRCAFENLSYQPENFNLKTLKHIFKRELYSCHKDLLQYGVRHESPLGTAVSLVCIVNTRGFLLHTGDSRIYKFTAASLVSALHINPARRLSRDHIDKSGRLTSCIGYGKKLQLHSKSIQINSLHSLLICSDGFYRRIQPEIIRFPSLIKLYPGNQFLNTLYSLAVKRGETDNASAILIQFTKSG